MFVLRLTEGEEGLCGWSAGGGKLTLQPSVSLKDVIDDAAARWNLKGHRVELIYNGAILRGKPACSTGSTPAKVDKILSELLLGKK